jgi:(p)ppGpp synthase/HD superfamily hydrolase
MVTDALETATDAHQGHTRKVSGRPFIEHPVSVASVLAEEGFDEDVVAAGLLHDVVEDTEATTDEVRERFGERVGALVDAMTDEAEIKPYERRKAIHRERVASAGTDAAAIYAADKLCNIRDFRTAHAQAGEAVAERFKAPLEVKLRVWQADLEMVSRHGSEIPHVDELEAELDGLRADLLAA